MKIKFISDVTLDPVIREIKSYSSGLMEIEYEYHENITSHLSGLDDESLNSYHSVFIHSDQYFHHQGDDYQVQLVNEVLILAERLKCYVFLSNSLVSPFASGNLKQSVGAGSNFLLNNSPLLQRIFDSKNIALFDYASVLMKVGLNEAFNYNLGHLYQMPYTKKMVVALAQRIFNYLHFYSKPEKKVIVTDCDNTLWQGIIGEDGIDNIACDLSSTGIIHHHFQRFLKQKKEEGFLLCINSKNNYSDVQEAFQKKRMPLQWDDFIVKEINWEEKPANIQKIAASLNLGVDSFIFIDDSDFEVNLVKEMLPGVTAIKFENSYTRFLEMSDDFIFCRKAVSKEDAEKTLQYEQERLRSSEKNTAPSFEEYVRNLDIKLDIRENDSKDFLRLSQLTEKTNQFNFNKAPYSIKELETFVSNGGTLYSLKVCDKYGDYGTVGLILMAATGTQVILENYLLSCRALGRQIEFSFFNHVMNSIAVKGLSLSEIKFKKTSKNSPAEEFLNRIKNGSETWRSSNYI